jgi:hypothetical protein
MKQRPSQCSAQRELNGPTVHHSADIEIAFIKPGRVSFHNGRGFQELSVNRKMSCSRKALLQLLLSSETTQTLSTHLVYSPSL